MHAEASGSGAVLHRQGAGGHRKYTVPLSAFGHAAVIAMLLSIPVRVLAPESRPLMPSMTVFVAPAPGAPLSRDADAVTGTRSPSSRDAVTPAGSARDVSGSPDGSSASAPRTPARVGSMLLRPVKTKDVRPVYPVRAQSARVEGTVVVEVTIGTDGKVVRASILRSIPLLDDAALEAVRQWEFIPTLVHGVPTPVIMTVSVAFTLR